MEWQVKRWMGDEGGMEGWVDRGRAHGGRSGYRPRTAERPRGAANLKGRLEEWKFPGVLQEGFLVQHILSFILPPL